MLPVNTVFVQYNSTAVHWKYAVSVHGDTKYWFIDDDKPTVVSICPPETLQLHIETYFTTDYLRVWILSDASLTFLSGFRLTATFENVGQNKSLRLNKLRQFSFVWIALEMTRRSVLLCLRVSHNVVFSSFFSTSLPFLRLGQGSLQFFYDPTRSLIRILAEKGNILPSDSQTLHSNHSSCFFLLLPSAVYQGIRIMV